MPPQVDTTAYGGDAGDLDKCRELWSRVRRDIQDGIKFMRQRQARDPHRTLLVPGP